MQDEESRMIRRFCGAILECREKEPYKGYIKKASEWIGQEICDDQQREALAEAIVLNVLNYKEYPFEFVQRKYGIVMGHKEFSRQKMIFCRHLAIECGLFGEQNASLGKWTKEGVLDMLYSIADEANGCITNAEGGFNHQVAGVALKAIDQAVKLSGLCTEEADQSHEISLEENASCMGA
ncbi:MAG: hypothetical protein HFE78_00490 [Clostridiales bacterium]|nr:hypothetical protein [Clostridiales bacterium]